jgi:hypothetical protein
LNYFLELLLNFQTILSLAWPIGVLEFVVLASFTLLYPSTSWSEIKVGGVLLTVEVPAHGGLGSGAFVDVLTKKRLTIKFNI